MFNKIYNFEENKWISIFSKKGSHLLKKYVLSYKTGGSSIQHEILGTKNYLEDLKNKSSKIWNNIQIENNNISDELNIYGSVIPHAGFEYSGLVALLSIYQIMEYNQTNEIIILWFKHNPNSEKEHSLQNILELY